MSDIVYCWSHQVGRPHALFAEINGHTACGSANRNSCNPRGSNRQMAEAHAGKHSGSCSATARSGQAFSNGSCPPGGSVCLFALYSGRREAWQGHPEAPPTRLWALFIGSRLTESSSSFQKSPPLLTSGQPSGRIFRHDYLHDSAASDSQYKTFYVVV